MKILFDEFDKNINNKKEYFKDMIEDFSKKNKKNDYQKIVFDLLNERYINKCENIIENKYEKFCDKWLILHSYFCCPYLIYIKNDINDNTSPICWEDDIFSISKEKLINLLINKKGKYLSLFFNIGMGLYSKKILEIENLGDNS